MGDARKRSTRRLSCPGIEALEGRAVPATFHATSVAELRADIAAVNNTSGPNTIILEARAYRDLTSELQIQNAGNLTIMGTVGKKGATTQLVGGVNNPVFAIENSTVTISGVLMAGSGIVAHGGVIEAENANLTLSKSTVTGGAATQAGGGIFTQGGTLNINDCSIVDNLTSGAGNSFGGAIATLNTNVTITRSRINSNTVSQITNMNPSASALASGGALYMQGGTVNISRTTLSNNKVSASTSGTTATALGGGLASVNAVVTIDRSTIANNTLKTIASQVNNTQGSAFSAAGGSLTITGSTVSGNLPAGKSEFAQAGVPVVLQSSTVDSVAMPGKYILGTNGFTPDN